MSTTIDEQFRLLREELASLRRETGGPPAVAVGFDRAAKMLDVSLSTVKRLVLRGDLIPVRLLGRKVLPVAEINRMIAKLSEDGSPNLGRKSVVTRTARAAPRPRVKSYSGKAAAAAIRAANKKPR